MAQEREKDTETRLTATADILGVWLMHALTGKLDSYLVDAGGNRVEQPKVPGTYGIKHDSSSTQQPFVNCAFRIQVRWDQWVEVDIECEHGLFTGASTWFNVTEALMRAVEAFNELDHPEPERGGAGG